MDHLPITFETVTSRILTLRGQRVMLDLDLASCTASRLRRKQAVRRNLDRFPDFMFELSEVEWKILRSQIVTSGWDGTRYPHDIHRAGSRHALQRAPEANGPSM